VKRVSHSNDAKLRNSLKNSYKHLAYNTTQYRQAKTTLTSATTKISYKDNQR
jgi:hypothetical protein